MTAGEMSSLSMTKAKRHSRPQPSVVLPKPGQLIEDEAFRIGKVYTNYGSPVSKAGRHNFFRRIIIVLCVFISVRSREKGKGIFRLPWVSPNVSQTFPICITKKSDWCRIGHWGWVDSERFFALQVIRVLISFAQSTFIEEKTNKWFQSENEWASSKNISQCGFSFKDSESIGSLEMRKRYRIVLEAQDWRNENVVCKKKNARARQSCKHFWDPEKQSTRPRYF